MVNLSATEARVEAMTQQYIQLRPLEGPGASGDDNADDNYFMYDDDENYQYEVRTSPSLTLQDTTYSLVISSTW